MILCENQIRQENCIIRENSIVPEEEGCCGDVDACGVILRQASSKIHPRRLKCKDYFTF